MFAEVLDETSFNIIAIKLMMCTMQINDICGDISVFVKLGAHFPSASCPFNYTRIRTLRLFTRANKLLKEDDRADWSDVSRSHLCNTR